MITLIAVFIMVVLWGALALYSRARVRTVEKAKSETAGRVRKAPSAHASRANKVISEEYEVFVPNIVETPEGFIDTSTKYVGVVAGTSCEQYGIKDGSIFLGDNVENGTFIKPGDFVVVKGSADHSNVEERIRRVETVDGLTLGFVGHRPRPKNEVVVKITHILAAA